MRSLYPLLIPVVSIFVIIFTTVFPVWKMRQVGRYSPFVENSLRLPGNSLRTRQSDLIEALIGNYLGLFATLMAGILVPSWVNYNGIMLVIVGSIFVLILVFIAYRINQNFRAAMNCKIGIQGEEYTGQELNLLTRFGAFVFHDIPYKYGNIDHVVVGVDAIFAVETKTVRKPANDAGNKQGDVVFDGSQLKFPHFATDRPLKQARCHADFLRRLLREECGCTMPVIPVVALPGWFVESGNKSERDIIVMNPRRGKYLHSRMRGKRKSEQFDVAVRKIESLARLDSPLASLTDPDAADHYNLWTNEPKVKTTR